MVQVNENRFDEQRHEANDKKRREQLGIENTAQGVPRNDQEAAPFRSQLAGVASIRLFINRHSRSPLPSKRCLPENRACNSNDEAAPAPGQPACTDLALPHLPAKLSSTDDRL